MDQLPLDYSWYFNTESPFPASLQETFDEQIKPGLIHTILVPHGILKKEDADYGFLNLVWRQPPQHEDLRVLTVMITAAWSTNTNRSGPVPHLTTWEYAAVQCRAFVNSHPEVQIFCGPPNTGYLIHIEIITEELAFGSRYLDVADKYLDKYDSWTPAIGEILGRSELQGHFQTMTMLRIGYQLPRESNPLTILITLFRECDRTKAWDFAEAEIRAYLHDQCSVPDVEVSIEWGDVFSYAFELLEPKTVNELLDRPDAYQQKVNLGSNIGVGRYLDIPDGNGTCKSQPGGGTLGGYIEYRITGKPAWRKAALTCYHVVRPAFPGFQLMDRAGEGHAPGPPQANSLLERLDRVGFSPTASFMGQDRREFLIEAPSRTLHNHTLRAATLILSDSEVAAGHDSEEAAKPRALRERIMSFFDNGKQHLGYPGFGSGYGRRRNGRRMDWAALEVEGSRRGTNALHTQAEWFELMQAHPRKFPFNRGHQLKQPTSTIRQPPSNPITPHPRAVYFGKGAISGWFSGYINGSRGGVHFKEDDHLQLGVSQELVMINPDQPRMQAARRSDSGAWIWNQDSQLVGMVFGGMSPASGTTKDALTYVTPIQDVFADMIDFSAGRIAEIRVADASP